MMAAATRLCCLHTALIQEEMRIPFFSCTDQILGYAKKTPSFGGNYQLYLQRISKILICPNIEATNISFSTKMGKSQHVQAVEYYLAGKEMNYEGTTKHMRILHEADLKKRPHTMAFQLFGIQKKSKLQQECRTTTDGFPGLEGGMQRTSVQWHSNGGHVSGCIAPSSLRCELWTWSVKDLSRQVHQV